MWSNSLTWKSASKEEQERWLRVHRNLELLVGKNPRTGVAHEALVPWTFEQWLQHRREIISMRARDFSARIQRRTELNMLRSTGTDIPLAPIPFNSKTEFISGPDRSAVLAEPTIWRANYSSDIEAFKENIENCDKLMKKMFGLNEAEFDNRQYLLVTEGKSQCSTQYLATTSPSSSLLQARTLTCNIGQTPYENEEELSAWQLIEQIFAAQKHYRAVVGKMEWPTTMELQYDGVDRVRERETGNLGRFLPLPRIWRPELPVMGRPLVHPLPFDLTRHGKNKPMSREEVMEAVEKPEEVEEEEEGKALLGSDLLGEITR